MSAEANRTALKEVMNVFITPEQVPTLGVKGLNGLTRKSLQQLAKDMGIKANLKSTELVEQILHTHALKQWKDAPQVRISNKIK
jgi:hypothetical protein